jgi:replication factor C large subunit
MPKTNEIPWIEKYRPHSIKDMVGFRTVIEKLRSFIEEFNQTRKQYKEMKNKFQTATDPNLRRSLELQLKSINQKLNTKKARLLMGPPGVGKTTVVYALANDLNMSVIEMNASDVRTQDAINNKLRETVKSNNLLFYTEQKTSGKIILLDEVDGISGNADRGGVSALEKIIETSQYPIIMTCNFRDDQKFGALYKLASPIIEIEPAKDEDVATLLVRIVNGEKLDITEEQVKAIAKRSDGDFRSAINDLQAVAQGGDFIEDATMKINMNRDNSMDVQDFFPKYFRAATFSDAKDMLDEVQQEDVEFRDFPRLFNENLLNYFNNNTDLAHAFEYLALVDRTLGIINRTQDYSHLSYFFDLLAGGIRIAKSDSVMPKSRLEFPRFYRLRATPDDENLLKLQKLFRLSLNTLFRESRKILLEYVGCSQNIRHYLAEKLGFEDESKLETIFE